MMDWMLEGEDVACPVDDMIGRKWTCSRSAVQSQRGCQWYCNLWVKGVHCAVGFRAVQGCEDPAIITVTAKVGPRLGST